MSQIAPGDPGEGLDGTSSYNEGDPYDDGPLPGGSGPEELVPLSMEDVLDTIDHRRAQACLALHVLGEEH